MLLEVSAALALPRPEQAILARSNSRELHGLLSVQGQISTKSASVQISVNPKNYRESANGLSYSGPMCRPLSAAENAVLTDLQDPHADSISFCFGIAEQCIRHEKIVKFLMSGSNSTEGLDPALLSELMGMQSITIDLGHLQYRQNDDELHYETVMDPSQMFLCAKKQVIFPDPILDLVGDQSHGSVFNIDQSGRLLLTGTGDDVKNILSHISEFDLSSRCGNRSTASLLVPYFDRKRRGGARTKQLSTVSVPVETVAPLKSPDTVKRRSASKKKNRKPNKERDLYQRNYFRACEALLWVLLGKNKGSMTRLSLKRSGPEVCKMLHQFSVGIAGSGLAIILSIACKTTIGRNPLSVARLLNAGVGLGLFWLSGAVNTLTDAVASAFKNTGKAEHEDLLVGEVEMRVSDVLFRAAALAAFAAVRYI